MAEAVRRANDSAKKTNGPLQEYQELFRGEVEIKASRMVLGSFPSWYRNEPYCVPAYDYVATLRPARVYAEHLAIITCDDTLVGETSKWLGRGLSHYAFKDLRLPAPRLLKGRVLDLLPGWDNFYHTLIEVAPKFRTLERAGIDIRSFDHYLFGTPKRPFEREILERFGVPLDRIVDPAEARHLEIEELVVPTVPFNDLNDKFAVRNTHGPWITAYLQDHFLDEADRKSELSRRRLYLSRRKAGMRRVANEDAVFEALQEHGFERIDADTYTVAEQARLFHSAEWIAGPHGAALANCIFCAPGTNLLELRATEQRNGTDDCFNRLCSFGSLNHYLLFTDTVKDPDTPSQNRDLIADIDLLKQMLAGIEDNITKPGNAVSAERPDRS
ncbi:MAG: glycosyltransferase family 61 protein [Cytophagales bacterium]|nr:glycosyltransferase family 61 protein [Armatimonadota bacterium]